MHFDRRDAGAAGVGLTMVSTTAPLLGIPIPLPALWAIFLSGICLVAWSIFPSRTAKGYFTRKIMMTPFAWEIVAVVLVFVAVGCAWKGYALYKDGYPLKWQWGTFINASPVQGASDLQFWGVDGSARNISGREVELKAAYVVSGMTGERIPFLFGDGYGKFLEANKFTPIQDDVQIGGRALFKTDREWITETEFWQRWGRIEFVAEYGDRVFRRSFSEQEIKETLAVYRPAPPRPRPAKRPD